MSVPKQLAKRKRLEKKRRRKIDKRRKWEKQSRFDCDAPVLWPVYVEKLANDDIVVFLSFR